jgi:hypothetical protein
MSTDDKKPLLDDDVAVDPSATMKASEAGKPLADRVPPLLT